MLYGTFLKGCTDSSSHWGWDVFIWVKQAQKMALDKEKDDQEVREDMGTMFPGNSWEVLLNFSLEVTDYSLQKLVCM